MTRTPMTREGREGRVRKFLTMCIDFGTMSGGQFRQKYPDQGVYEGYGYVEKKARALAASLQEDEVGRG